MPAKLWVWEALPVDLSETGTCPGPYTLQGLLWPPPALLPLPGVRSSWGQVAVDGEPPPPHTHLTIPKVLGTPEFPAQGSPSVISGPAQPLFQAVLLLWSPLAERRAFRWCRWGRDHERPLGGGDIEQRPQRSEEAMWVGAGERSPAGQGPEGKGRPSGMSREGGGNGGGRGWGGGSQGSDHVGPPWLL